MSLGGRGPKEKGAKFERKTSQRLSIWISGGVREDLLWRSATSGGRATFRSRRGLARADADAGDLASKHPDGFGFLAVFFVECKHLERLSLDAPFFGLDGQMRQLWWKPLEQARDVGREPLVVAKQDNKQEIVLTTSKGWRYLSGGEREPGTFKARGMIGDAIVFLLNDLLTLADYSKMLNGPLVATD